MAVHPAGTSFVTTAPAPIFESAPTEKPLRTTALAPIIALAPTAAPPVTRAPGLMVLKASSRVLCETLAPTLTCTCGPSVEAVVTATWGKMITPAPISTLGPIVAVGCMRVAGRSEQSRARRAKISRLCPSPTAMTEGVPSGVKRERFENAEIRDSSP